jgi:hypothetical protein
MANVKFGFGQIFKPSPQWAKNVFRTVLYTSAVVGILSGIITEVPPTVKVIVLKYSLEATAAVHALSKLFGIDITDDPTKQP